MSPFDTTCIEMKVYTPCEASWKRRRYNLSWFLSDAVKCFLDVRQDNIVECGKAMNGEGTSYPDICDCSGCRVEYEVVGDERNGDEEKWAIPRWF